MTNSLVEYNWDDSLEIFNELKSLYSKSDKSETISRLIINRAYYCVYGKISQFLRIKGLYTYDKIKASKSGHKDLISKLDDMTLFNLNQADYLKDEVERKRYKRIRNSLKKLLVFRKNADYDYLCLEGHLQIAQYSILLTNYIFMLLSKINVGAEFDYQNETEPK